MRDLSKAIQMQEQAGIEAMKSTMLRNMLFDTLDYLEPLLDQLAPLDRAHVERIKAMSGWKSSVDVLAELGLLPADNGRAE